MSEAATLPIRNKEEVVVEVEDVPKQEVQEQPNEEHVVDVENVSERGSIHEVSFVVQFWLHR